ncbi:MAG: PilZ domain-containing protein [Provencibacterium sp.]|jgi:hypothetical protein|nr:PilZ domain-containing protein [Provencibacterium sp.]
MLWKKEDPKKKEKPLPLPGEYLSSVCEVKTVKNELVATGTITEITPEYIQIADRGNTMVGLRFGSVVKVNIFNSRLGYRVLEGKVYLSTQQFLRLVELNILLDREQRGAFRVRTSIRGKLFWPGKPAAAEPGAASPAEAAISGTGLSVTVEDLSVGGALLRGEERIFGGGDQLVLQFMPVNLMLQLNGVIRRVESQEDGTVRYGFEFQDIPDAQQDALCAYLFQRQREQINQRRR